MLMNDKIVKKAIGDGKKQKIIKGSLVLMKKNVLDLNDFNASILDGVHEFFGHKVSLQLVSSTGHVHDHDPAAEKGVELGGRIGRPAYLKDWVKKGTMINLEAAGESAFDVEFDWDEEEEVGINIPGAFIIKNFHHTEFYLKTLTIEHFPGHGRLHFICNSWVYPTDKYRNKYRIFFVNQTYLPSETPSALRKYREEELVELRGDGNINGELKEWDRVYDYALYNDLGVPDLGSHFARPVLGGSTQFPYPRRGRTGRPPTISDPNTESRLPLVTSLNIYVPRDERFGHLKLSDFLGYALKSVVQVLLPEFQALHDHDHTPNEFDTMEDFLKLFEKGIKLPAGSDLLLNNFIKDNLPLELIKEIFRTDGEGFLKFPTPAVIKEDKSAWRTDEEFAREMLAGVDPIIISRLQEFPPKSKLDDKVYGNQNSTITREQVENKLDGLTIEEAMKRNKLYVLDHHDMLMPYVRRINTTSNKIYATRTLLFLQENGTLKPLAIELSLPHPNGDELGAVSKVYLPPTTPTPHDHDHDHDHEEEEEGSVIEASLWQLAKAYVAVNDSGVHQLISHWLRTHAVIEPFIIATNRQLSVLHPIHKLLKPHFRDTMNINALARQVLINGGGILESTVFPSKYAMEMSAVVYKDWIFTEQALPADLLKRGMAVKDPKSPNGHGLRLLIKDYPYAVDGLEIWSAIETWVEEYCKFYYKTDEMVEKDSEVQAWWKEVREEGHGDKKDEPWWPKMHTLQDLIDSCTIIIWIASALHAAVNFGQYPYAGYLPNRPTISRRYMPEPGTPEYEELKTNPDRIFLRTITPQLQTLLGVSLIEILSRHTTDEVYLGQTDTPEWTTDSQPLKAFHKFGKKLTEIGAKIVQMNNDSSSSSSAAAHQWINRLGPVEFPYTLLYPTSEPGLTAKGIPNSISI